VNPYQIVANNSHFYLIGNYDKYDDVSHYRLDKMTCVNILNELDKTGTIEVSLHCNEDAMFYWALQYGPYVEIIEPQSLRERIKHAVQEMSKKYAREGKSYE
jgi:predicted DNA-binding transcriptional regulator YafY